MEPDAANPLSDVRLAVTLAPLGADAAESIRWCAQAGFEFIQWSATHPGAQAADMDGSSRRGVRSALVSAGVAASGVDFVPFPESWERADQVDRLHAAFLATIELSVALGRLPVTIDLPARDLHGVAMACLQEADRTGVPCLRLVPPQAVPDWATASAHVLGACLETGRALAGGLDPLSLLTACSPEVAHIRLVDVDSAGRRGVPGALPGGRLDWRACTLAARLSASRTLLLLDAAGCADPRADLVAGVRAMRGPGAVALSSTMRREVRA
ncbi:MAG: hypothetical protein O2819_08065 [Planctomycetota bacterium]|nr:hypothetical protein [Planctomycetota bacterium]MDA1106089.1 hypothetical protein [Planctomycetota bacterium]